MNIEKAINKLKEKGYKRTKQRKRILEIFAEQDQGYIPAKTMLKEIQKDFPGVSYDTIYRNLYLLADEHVLESTELEGEKHFRFHCDTHGHHHHFICTACGKTKAVEFCPMDKIRQSLDGYAVDDHKFEIYGKCPGCL